MNSNFQMDTIKNVNGTLQEPIAFVSSQVWMRDHESWADRMREGDTIRVAFQAEPLEVEWSENYKTVLEPVEEVKDYEPMEIDG